MYSLAAAQIVRRVIENEIILRKICLLLIKTFVLLVRNMHGYYVTVSGAVYGAVAVDNGDQNTIPAQMKIYDEPYNKLWDQTLGSWKANVRIMNELNTFQQMNTAHPYYQHSCLSKCSTITNIQLSIHGIKLNNK